MDEAFNARLQRPGQDGRCPFHVCLPEGGQAAPKTKMTGGMNDRPAALTGRSNGRRIGYILCIGQINAVAKQKFDIAGRPDKRPNPVSRVAKSRDQIMTKKPGRAGYQDHRKSILILYYFAVKIKPRLSEKQSRKL
jgi:hypothetical protein